MKFLPTLFLAAVCTLRLAAGDARLEIDKPQSRLEYTVKTTFETFTGRLTAYELSASADPALGKITRAQLRFRFSDLVSDNEKRDLDMRTWQNTEQFPEVVFTLVALEPAGEGRSTARGQLILHGVTREITFPVSVSVTAGPQKLFSMDGETSLDTRDFGLPVLRRYMFGKVDPHVKIRWHFQGTPLK